MAAKWFLITSVAVAVGALAARAVALAPDLAPDVPTRDCVGDLDGDGDTDWGDLCILVHDWDCAPPDVCIGDVDGDGDTDLSDLSFLLADWGCGAPEIECDPPGGGVLDVSIASIDNSSVGPGDDPLAPEFDGGNTHFTFDIQVQVDDPSGDWCAAYVDSVITASARS